MEGIARLISESVARQGMDWALDHRRLYWSRWIPCKVCDPLLVPARPGLCAIAEEWIASGEAAVRAGKVLLAISQVYATEDLAMLSKATESEPERCTPTQSRSKGRAAGVHPPAPLPSGFCHGEPWRNALVH
jgi:hypothetical protein